MRRSRKEMTRTRAVVLGLMLSSGVFAACGWNPSRPFEREAPPVNEAIAELDGGDASTAAAKLQDYLSTGPCAEGNIGTPELLKKRPNGAFDLGLTLFKVGESFGKRFGDEEIDSGGADEIARGLRGGEIECALRIVRAVATDDSQTIELRARARYLEGNLLFLDGKYEEAVRAYDQALALAPGMHDAGDPIGRDAAYNRAIALRRIEDKKDAGQDAAKDASEDAPKDGSGEGGGDSGQGDGGKDSGGGNDASQPDANGDPPDAGAPPPPPPADDAGPPPPPKANQDERMLDQLENAPTVQQEAAKKQAGKRRVRGMADK